MIAAPPYGLVIVPYVLTRVGALVGELRAPDRARRRMREQHAGLALTALVAWVTRP